MLPIALKESLDDKRISSMKRRSAPSVRAFATFETASPTAEARSGRSDSLGMCALGITSVCPALKGRISMQLYETNALQVNEIVNEYLVWQSPSPFRTPFEQGVHR